MHRGRSAIAARITPRCVTATSRASAAGGQRIHPAATRSIRSTTDSPPCGARVGSVSHIARSRGQRPGPGQSPRHRPQSRSASRLSMLACRPSSSAVCLVRFSGPQYARVDGTQIDGRVDLAVADGVERLVGGESSGRHRVGHGVRYEGEPDDLRSRRTHWDIGARRFSSSSREASAREHQPDGRPHHHLRAQRGRAGTRRGRLPGSRRRRCCPRRRRSGPGVSSIVGRISITTAIGDDVDGGADQRGVPRPASVASAARPRYTAPRPAALRTARPSAGTAGCAAGWSRRGSPPAGLAGYFSAGTT